MNGRRNIKESASSSEVTSAVYNAVSEGTRFVETIETPKPGRRTKDVNPSTPPSITEKSRVGRLSRLARKKSNESVSEPRKSFMYSRNTNDNIQEVR
jgi:zinc transporter 6